MFKVQSEQSTKLPVNQKIEQEKINLVAVTWNLFGSLPPIDSLTQLSKTHSFMPPPDIIYFATQECQRSLCLSFCCQAKTQWQLMLSEVFSQYSLMVTYTMGGLHSAVLVKYALRQYFSLEQKTKLKAGFCNLLGNKGAISIQLSLLGQKFQLINCHLAASQSGLALRNETISRVMEILVSKYTESEIIFLGDLNYRIQMGKRQYETMIANRRNTQEEMKYFGYLKKEQLTNQPQLKDEFLSKFEEGAITFPPTYKIGVNSNEYNRERIPGWTDRIFHRKNTRMTRLDYICEYFITGSDHRPVLARYQKIFEDRLETEATINYIPVKSKNCQLI